MFLTFHIIAVFTDYTVFSASSSLLTADIKLILIEHMKLLQLFKYHALHISCTSLYM